MKRLLGLVLMVTLTVATLTALAYATPPDQSWIHGVYDDADYDEIILLATSASSIMPDPADAKLRPFRSVLYIVPSPHSPVVTAPAVPPQRPRGPPTA